MKTAEANPKVLMITDYYGLNLLVVEDHGIILSLLAVVLALFSCQLILEVVCRQPELQYIHRLLFLHVLQGTQDKKHCTSGWGCALFQVYCML